jgi:uncharacterized paraquat-inducible protein A
VSPLWGFLVVKMMLRKNYDGFQLALIPYRRAVDLDRVTTEEQTRQCPRCAETVKIQAKGCRYCGAEFRRPQQKSLRSPPILKFTKEFVIAGGRTVPLQFSAPKGTNNTIRAGRTSGRL